MPGFCHSFINRYYLLVSTDSGELQSTCESFVPSASVFPMPLESNATAQWSVDRGSLPLSNHSWPAVVSHSLPGPQDVCATILGHQGLLLYSPLAHMELWKAIIYDFSIKLQFSYLFSPNHIFP
jgi:hypothetical protein